MDLIRTGRWEDVLRDLEPDTVITDPPFGARTHEGARTTAEHNTEGITFEHWTRDDVFAFVRSWAPRTRRWIVPMTSHDLIPAWEDAFTEAGMYPFAPVTAVILGMGVRKQGDGPSNWTIHIVPGRHRTRERMANPESNGTALWRALPGAYVVPRDEGGDGRRKPHRLCCALVRDYSNRGDLIADPCAGYGSGIRAALELGRAAIGAEMDPKVAAEARAELQRPLQVAFL